MDAPLPSAMYVSRRAICPGCGATLALAGARAQATCPYCGRTSVVERRLREVEPVARERRAVEVDWTPSHLNPGTATEDVKCWGCGAALPVEGLQSIVRCGVCASESKLERRLRLLDLDVPIVEEDEDVATAVLVERIAQSADLAERVTLAREGFGGWGHVNRTLARRAGQIMEVMRDADPRLAHAAGEAIGKLLCHDDKWLRDAAIQAAERFLQDPKGSQKLIWEVGLGPPVCLKPLLDAADVLFRKGALALSCQALLAANTLIGRNLGEKARMGEIVLYRLIYLTGPVLAWSLKCLGGGHPLYHPPPVETLIRFVDDCAAERPKLVAEVLRGARETELKNETEYRARLDLLRELESAEAREAWLRLLPAPPSGTSLRLRNAARDLVAPLVSDARLGEAARAALARITKAGGGAGGGAGGAFSPPEPARDPEIEQAEWLLKEGIDLAIAAYRDEADALKRYWDAIRDRTPLMAAALRGDLEATRALVDAGAEVDETNEHGRTALAFAAEGGRLEIARELLSRGAGIEARDRDGKTAAMLAAEANQVEMLRALPLTAEERQEALLAAMSLPRPPLEAVRALLELGADPDLVDDDGMTPLFHAIRDGRNELAQVLLDANAVVDHQDAKGRNALLHAIEGRNVEMLGELLRRGLRAEVKAAALEGADPEVARLLAAHGIRPAVDPAVLFEAIRSKKEDRVRAALDAGLDANARDKDGAPAIYAAANWGGPAIVRLLLDRGADPDAPTASGGHTALMRAMVRPGTEIVEALIARGARVDAEDAWGGTALLAAARGGRVDLARLLLRHGADPNHPDRRGENALAAAGLRRGNDEMIALLREAGAREA